ncbi:hypothetical protein QUA62_02715 [Microcoleus sp. MON1_C1]|uniref:hypothetical protein n=1 Tax=Microcoleus sp. MON1_C1 TaxID=2818827 RepID=UPI002FD5D531
MNAAKTTEKSARSLMNDQQALREADRAQAHRNELTNSLCNRLFVRMGRLICLKDCTSIASPHLRNALIVSLSLPLVSLLRAAKKFFWAAIASVRPEALSASYDRTADCQPNSGSLQGATVP